MQFARYLAQEMQTSQQFESNSDDEDEEEGGWLARSTFGLNPPPSTTRHNDRNPPEPSTFDVRLNIASLSLSSRTCGQDTFGSTSNAALVDSYDDPFSADDVRLFPLR
jgi:serine/threonine-protein phosphatase 6 regulatory subunit 3